MAEKKKKVLSVKEAFAKACITATLLKDHGTKKKGDEITGHKTTINALRVHGVVK